MKIHDITQEVFSCRVFPGDTGPAYKQASAISAGAVCNLSVIEMGVHNGTHLDAPWHFLDDGKKMDEIDLERCIGPALVVAWHGEITAAAIRQICRNNPDNPACQRLLFKGDCSLSLDGAKALTKYQVKLIGVESQSVAPSEAPVPVHLELLANEIMILEGLVLCDVPTKDTIGTEAGELAVGEYFLLALPLKLGGRDGSPCRAVLLEN